MLGIEVEDAFTNDNLITICRFIFAVWSEKGINMYDTKSTGQINRCVTSRRCTSKREVVN